MSVNASNLHPKYQTTIQSDLHRESIKSLLSDKNFVKSGLAVTAGTGLSVNISAGSCMVGGVYITFNASTLSVPASSTVQVVVELQVDANNKPTGAIIKHQSSFTFPQELQLWLATVTTSSSSVSSVTDRRVFRTKSFAGFITSSQSQYWYNSWIHAIFAGGGGGGRQTSTMVTTGGAGGEVVVNYYFHRSGTITFTVGAGGIGGSSPTAGGNSSITINTSSGANTETANGGNAGVTYGSGIHSINNLVKFYGSTKQSKIFLDTVNDPASPIDIAYHTPYIAGGSIGGSATNSFVGYIFSFAIGAWGTRDGQMYAYASLNNNVDSSGLLSQGGNSGSSPTNGTAGKFYVHIWEV